MTAASFTVVLLKPEIASGMYAFVPRDVAASEQSLLVPTPTDEDNGEQAAIEQRPLQSSIVGVSAHDAALLFTNGQILSGIFARIASARFRVKAQRAVELTKPQARALYSHERLRLQDDASFRAYLESLTCGLSLALLLELPEPQSPIDAVVRWRDVAGSPNPIVARQDALSASLPHDEWPLYALCGLNAVQNSIQSSATLDCAIRERAALFPDSTPRLQRGIVVILPSFQATLSDGKALLLAKLHAGSVLVARVIDNYNLTSSQALAALATALHPTTSKQDGDAFLQALQQQTESGANASCLLELEALGLDAKLHCLLGPSSVDDARIYFPDSVRAQLPASLCPSLAHVQTRKGTVTGLDSGVFTVLDTKSVQALLACSGLPATALTAIEQTFAIIKPGTANDSEAVRAIQATIRAFGFTIDKQCRLRLTRAQAATFYSEHCGKPFFERLLAFMTSNVLIAMQLSRRNAVAVWRALMGPTNALQARVSHPWTLRARFGIDGTRNATHGSDSQSSAHRELQFFFGSAFGADAPTSSLAAAQRALHAPYRRDETLERVLTLALDEMLTQQVSTQLDACTWLGHWLLEYAQRQQQGADASSGSDTADTSPQQYKLMPATYTPLKKPAQPALVTPMDELAGSNRSLVAITFTRDVSDAQRAAVSSVLHSLAMLPFAVVETAAAFQQHAQDAGAAATALAQLVRDTGKRRVLLVDVNISDRSFIERFHAASQSVWCINAAITIRNRDDAAGVTSALSSHVSRVHYQLPSSPPIDSELDAASIAAFFTKLLCPTIYVVQDLHHRIDVATWRVVASRTGVKLLVFDELVHLRIAHERDVNGVFTQLQRTRATIPSELLLTLVHDAVYRIEPGAAGIKDTDNTLGFSQQFLLCGFPLATMSPISFAQRVGRISGVLRVHHNEASSGAMGAWVTQAIERGTLTDIRLCSNANASLHIQARALYDTCVLALSPFVGLYVSSVSSEQSGTDARVVRAAHAHGFVVIDVSEVLPDKLISYLERMLLHHGTICHNKTLVCGFPPLSDVLYTLIERIAAPRFIVFADAASTSLPEVDAALDVFPQIAQLDLMRVRPTSGTSDDLEVDAALQTLLFGKRIAFVVGDAKVLDATRLRSLLAPLGYSVLDLRNQQLQKLRTDTTDQPLDVIVRDLVTRVLATATSRCLVLGSLEHSAFFETLQTAIGSIALARIVVLKHVERQAPPVRAAKRTGDDDDDDYYSDDETELERQRQHRARTALPAHLDDLLQRYGSKSGSESSAGALATRLNYFDVATVYESIRIALAPQVLGVVGNPFTFYERALRSSARRRAIATVTTRWWRTLQDVKSAAAARCVANSGDIILALDQKVAALQRLVATTPFATYVLDAFPRTPTNGAAPYVAQQLVALAQAVAPMQAVLHCTASMDALFEHKTAETTRNELEDAQDALETATRDAIAAFATKHPNNAVLSVTCDTGLADAENEFDDVLRKVVGWRCL